MKLIVEKDIEQRLRRRVEQRGGLCLKLTAKDGIPDRLVVLPDRAPVFVELKRPVGGRLAPIQEYEIKRLRSIGQRVFVIKNFEEIEAFLAKFDEGNTM